jgi:hypothetical protein
MVKLLDVKQEYYWDALCFSHKLASHLFTWSTIISSALTAFQIVILVLGLFTCIKVNGLWFVFMLLVQISLLLFVATYSQFEKTLLKQGAKHENI